jgi:hypothetical protein
MTIARSAIKTHLPRFRKNAAGSTARAHAGGRIRATRRNPEPESEFRAVEDVSPVAI